MSHLNRYICLTALLFTALTGEAVQLGTVKGSAVFGRPLDLSMQVRLDAPAEEAANCFSAEVFQADNKFDVGRVRLDVTPAANGLDATVRVRSVTAVNEPWAKVILRSNCGAKVSRQYDFLTDFATDIPTGNMLAETAPAQPTVNTAIATAAAKSSATIAQAPVSNWSVKRSQAKDKATQQKLDTQIAQTPLTPRKVKQTTPSSAFAAAGAKKTTDMVADAVGQSRLKMETFELTDEHQVLLKLSTALVAPTGMRTPEEIQALAQATAVWRAINGMPAEVKAVESPATDAVVAAQTNTPAVQMPPAIIPALVNQKLAGKSEFSNLIVYGLIGLLALTLACIAWLWMRVRQASRAGYGWLSDSMTDESMVEHEPTQYMHSNFYATEPETTPQVEQEPQEPSFETDNETEATTAPVSTAAKETLVDDFRDEKPPTASLQTPARTGKTVAKTTANKPIVSPMPSHFDDARFDERVLRSKKKSREVVHKQPIASSSELMDLVLADTPPKLRAVATPAPEQADKLSHLAANKSTATNDDSKGNLIDFDVFAEPEPLNKPTRFVR